LQTLCLWEGVVAIMIIRKDRAVGHSPQGGNFR